MTLISEIAEAIRVELADADISQNYKAIRAYRHDETFSTSSKGILVAVVPKGIKFTAEARGFCRHELEIFVVVTKKIDKGSVESVDPLVNLTEQIIEFFSMRRLKKQPDAMWLATEIKPLISTEHLEQEIRFTSLITLKYLITKQISHNTELKKNESL